MPTPFGQAFGGIDMDSLPEVLDDTAPQTMDKQSNHKATMSSASSVPGFVGAARSQENFGGPGMQSEFSQGEGLRRVGTTMTSLSAANGGGIKKQKSSEVLRTKLPNFMRHNLPDQEKLESQVGSHKIFIPPWMTPDAYHEAYTTRVLERRLLIKNLAIATVAEFIGTFFFLFFALGINTTVQMNKDAEKSAGQDLVDIPALLVSSLGFGFSLAICAWVFFRVSGGVQNPAITVALFLTGSLSWMHCILLTIAQYAGGIAGAALVSGLFPGSVNARTTLGANVTVNQGFWLEFFITDLLILAVLMLAGEKHRATFLAPVGIGLALFVTQLLGQPYTGASVNPARTLGPDVAERKFESYCWIYFIAPYFSAIVTSVFFLSLKWLKYETASPDQDADENRAGQMLQVIHDANGKIIGTVGNMDAEEYKMHEKEGSSENQETLATGIQQHPSMEFSQTLGEQPTHLMGRKPSRYASQTWLSPEQEPAQAQGGSRLSATRSFDGSNQSHNIPASTSGLHRSGSQGAHAWNA